MDERLYRESCPLKGSRTCKLLHMGACDTCPGKKPRERKRLVKLTETFAEKVDGELLASLFESECCTLCKGEEKGEKTGYGIWDMGYPVAGEKNATKEKKTSGKAGLSGISGLAGVKELFGEKPVKWEFLLPVQFACCTRCRRRMLVVNYLPTAGLILGLGISLLLVGPEPMAEALRAAWRGLPLLLALVFSIGGYAGGRFAAWRLKHRFGKEMWIDPMRHPVVRQLTYMGWRPVLKDRERRLIFSKEPLTQGLGTAPGWFYREEPLRELENPEEEA